MKPSIIALVLIAASAGAASATTSCQKTGHNSYNCSQGGNSYKVSNVASAEAAAAAIAKQSQEQAQDQHQSQSVRNSNDNSNSVNIEGAPSMTANLGVGLNFSVPIASGVQTRNAIDTANWFIQNGQSCIAYQIMSKAPRVRNLKITFNCGDKG
jgi:hypothetical protein